MRAFIALELPERFEDEVADLARLLGENIEGRFMRRDTYHLTLAFLGEVDDAARASAMDAMDEAAEGMGVIPLACDGLGKFGKPRDATLWLGVQRTEELESLAARLRDGLARRGVAFDSKPFRAHITLARRARIPKGQLPALPFPQPDEAVRVTLFRSTLTHEGATYKPLYTIELA